ncbi:short-chain fatty acyl-CoA regulator family protein [Jannaschia ovalis]|uniref:Short-chain fatty acyl-CoA regulator family protein n=1 Tax=Jannaschia ovalis TaxID=3038773 RepID=A0ABY8LCG7_9RHOB|nr:short-chain fatty acyl-CoA regulator family protein [Jannaschia sp. GRR-S6-38]WGH77849.1 short-chain fatty acyl-CoA regulator family protein [Jannaschia sp. GRR-S6-38]
MGRAPSRPAPTGSRLRDRRLAAGIKQVDLAAAAGISPSYLNLIEHNRRAIGGGLLGKLADALGVDRAALSEDGDAPLVGALREAGAAHGLEAEALDEAAELARRHPRWAGLLAHQAEALAGQARMIEALSDRLTHDPALAEALHELLSTVSSIRSTASILAQTPEIDRNWLGRFHVNLDSESRRLAQGAEAVVSYFDREAGRGAARLLPAEIVSRFLDAHGHRFDALEREGAAAIPGLVAELDDPEARAIAEAILAADAADAARLPRARVEAAADPSDLIPGAEGDLALILRRMGLTDPGRGLVVIDASGALVRRKPVAGFPLPVMGAGCPLWPVYAALAQPGRPLVETIETPDGAGWRAHAVAQPLAPASFGAAPVMRATMLLTRAGASAAARPVGPGCRTCPRAGCAARREPSILRLSETGLDSATGGGDTAAT